MNLLTEGTPTATQFSVVKALLVSLPIIFVCCLIGSSQPLMYTFALIPSHTLLVHNYIWNIATHVFLETEPISLAVTLSALSWAGGMEEAIGGPSQLCIFLAVPTVAMSLCMIIGGALVARVGLLWLYMAYSGGLPLAVSLALLKAQLSPSEVVLPWTNALRARYVPMLIWCYAVFDDLFVADASPTLAQIEAGGVFKAGPGLTTSIAFLSAWFYLRFVRRSGTTRGDPSASFALHRLFAPAPLRLLVAAMGRICFPFVRLFGLGAEVATMKAEVGTENDNAADRLLVVSSAEAPISEASLCPLPGSTQAEAERRRELALIAMKSRMQRAEAAAATVSSTATDGLEDFALLSAPDATADKTA